MRQPKRAILRFCILTCLVGLTVQVTVNAQALWKYTDKDGKVTYSDKAPKKGETAQQVTSNPSANIINAPKGARESDERRLEDMKGRVAEDIRVREKLREAFDVAKQELDAAKAALESGRDPLPVETQIRVGRNKKGEPTGVNTVVRNPEYYARIASLEEAVKKAEEKVEAAEKSLGRGGS